MGRSKRTLVVLLAVLGLLVSHGAVTGPAMAASATKPAPANAVLDLRLAKTPRIGGSCVVSFDLRTAGRRVGNEKVAVQKRRSGKDAWRTVKTLRSKPDGRVRFKATAYEAWSFRAVHRGSERVRATVSDSVRCSPKQLVAGSRTPAVKKVQTALRKQGYRPASRSGVFDSDTSHAVTAFQKHHKLPRTGKVDAKTYRKIRTAKRAKAPKWCKSASRICVDLSMQTAYLKAKNGKRYVIPVSTGNNKWYRTSSGKRELANTPVGKYKVYLKRPGRTNGPLGTYYWFSAYHRGWGVHGSNSVPAHPASHGCTRVPRSIERWVYKNLPSGSQVHIHS